MDEFISREATIKRIKKVYCVGCNSYNGVRCRACGTGDAIDIIEDAPAADVALVVLPCKVGDTVYEVTSRKTISEYRVKAIRVELFCTFIEWDIVAGFVDKSIFGVPVNELGKTVFLTCEEAEKALEAMK